MASQPCLAAGGRRQAGCHSFTVLEKNENLWYFIEDERTVCQIREFKIPRLRTTATVKHATAHDLNHVTVHFSRVVLRLR